jgi:ribosome-associated translation inhibitor RaiA
MAGTVMHPDAAEVGKDREFKAHVYQQLVDLQPFLSPESQVTVVVKVAADEKDSRTGLDEDYQLTLVANLGDHRLETEGRNADLYEALGIAKRKMLQQLDDVYGSVIDANERSSEIDALLKGELTIH